MSDNERLIGTAGDNVLTGGGGKEILLGHGGNDTLSGGDGDDVIFGDGPQVRNTALAAVHDYAIIYGSSAANPASYTEANLKAANHDLLVINPARLIDNSSSNHSETLWTAASIANIKNGSKLVLSYLDLTKINDYVGYWDDSWTSNHLATGTSTGTTPSWLGALDPGDTTHTTRLINLADPNWVAGVTPLFYSRIDQIVATGVDGIFFDDIVRYFVDGNVPQSIAQAAELQGLVTDLANHARATVQGLFGDAAAARFAIIVNGAPYITTDSGAGAAAATAYFNAIDGILAENYFSHSDDLAIGQTLREYGARGIAMFSADTNVASGSKAALEAAADGAGFIPETVSGGIYDGDSTRFVSALGDATPGGDTLNGGDGNDVIHGGGGNDTINPGLGIDTAYGGAGDDLFTFTAVQTGSLSALNGRIDGGAGNDTIDLRNIAPVTLGTVGGGLGMYVGSQGYTIANVERILLGSANDFVSLLDRLDPVEIRAGAGNDDITGSGAYRLYGEDGDDSIFISGRFGGASSTGIADGGAGHDTLKLNIAFTVDLAAGTAVSGNAQYAIASFEEVQVAAKDGYLSTVYGSAAGETLSVNPLFNDGSVGVVFDGRGGDDILSGSKGADKLYGGTGNDSFIVDRQDDIVFENAGEGTDTVTASASYYLYANIENLTLAAGAGGIFGVGNELANTITGNEGANTLLAGAGNDTVHGGAGVDILYGEDGNDQLFGDADNDVIVGGAGNDVIDGGTGGDSLYGEDGNDTLTGGTDFVFDQLVGGVGDDILHGDSGLGDFDYLIGNAGDDSYYVDTYADLVFENAGEGTDTVYASTAAGSGYYLYANIENLVLAGSTFYGVGNELANRMTGSALDNWLLGGAGNDILNGKAGNDVLFGQDGADTFVFEHGTGGDTIADFTAGTDKIDLSAFGFTSFAQVQAAMSETGGSSAIVLGGGDLIVLQNVTNASLHAGDFILSGGSAVQVEPLMRADPDDVSRGGLVHQFDAPHAITAFA